MVGAYSTAMSIGATVAAVATAPIAAAVGADGWRWALGIWAVFALLAAVPWLFVRATPGASRGTHTAVRLRSLWHSRMALALMVFFGVQGLEAYIIIGWSAQYLRDAGLTAAAAGLLLGLNQVIGIPLSALVPALTVRPRLQRPLLLGFMACYAVGWVGLWVAPRTAPWLWMAVLSVAMASFPMILTLLGLRARTPETTAALSTYVQSWGYLISAVGPLLVGVLLGATGSYSGMFVLVLAGVRRPHGHRLVHDARAVRRRRGEPVRPGLVVDGATARTSWRWPAPRRRSAPTSGRTTGSARGGGRAG